MTPQAPTLIETWNTCPICFQKWKDETVIQGLIHRTRLCALCQELHGKQEKEAAQPSASTAGTGGLTPRPESRTEAQSTEAARTQDSSEALENPPCVLCGGPHPFDTSIPSVVWNEVIRRAELPDYLCLTCIVRAFASVERSFTAELVGGVLLARVPIEVQVNGQVARDAAEIQTENNRLRWELREQRQALLTLQQEKEEYAQERDGLRARVKFTEDYEAQREGSLSLRASHANVVAAIDAERRAVDRADKAEKALEDLQGIPLGFVTRMAATEAYAQGRADTLAQVKAMVERRYDTVGPLEWNAAISSILYELDAIKAHQLDALSVSPPQETTEKERA